MNKHEKKVSRGENSVIYLNVLILSFDIDLLKLILNEVAYI